MPHIIYNLFCTQFHSNFFFIVKKNSENSSSFFVMNWNFDNTYHRKYSFCNCTRN